MRGLAATLGFRSIRYLARLLPSGRNLFFADSGRRTTDSGLANDQRGKADDLFEIRHLHRRQRGLEALVPHLQPRAINGLFERVARENTKSVRDASFLRRLSNAARDFIHDDVVVGSVSTQEATNGDDGVVLF